MFKPAVVILMLSAILALEAVSCAPTLVHSMSRMDSVAKESQHIHANIHGRTKFLAPEIDDTTARQIETPREGRSKHRKEASVERYPSPHGKDARWRFDLRHTVESDMSMGVRGSISYQSPSKAVFQRGVLRAHVI